MFAIGNVLFFNGFLMPSIDLPTEAEWELSELDKLEIENLAAKLKNVLHDHPNDDLKTLKDGNITCRLR